MDYFQPLIAAPYKQISRLPGCTDFFFLTKHPNESIIIITLIKIPLMDLNSLSFINLLPFTSERILYTKYILLSPISP